MTIQDFTSSAFNQFNSTDNHLLNRAQLESQDSWQNLANTYAPLIYQFVRKVGLQPNDAADVTQNVLLQLCKSLPKFRRKNIGSFRKWLKVIAYNKANDFLRKQKSLIAADQLYHPQCSNQQGILTAISEREHNQQETPPMNERELKIQLILHQVKNQVTENTWKAFQMMTAEMATSEEIGQQLGMSAATVRMAKKRVLQKIQTLWKESQEPSS